jgi:hypothetical protein
VFHYFGSVTVAEKFIITKPPTSIAWIDGVIGSGTTSIFYFSSLVTFLAQSDDASKTGTIG